ncbi:MAG: SpoIID/LytB domain-containing protein [Smithella sp.]|nr:SpoIID/LytB domain-containing protein [Smithella sp.]
MMNKEPEIRVALLQHYNEASLVLNGDYLLPGGRVIKGRHYVYADQDNVLLVDASENEIARGGEIILSAAVDSCFTLTDVKIGIDFHWQRTQEQTFRGNIMLLADDSLSFRLLNEIPLEDYLASVISSEMSAEAPLEFLKAQAIVARSWLAAMLKKKTLPRQASGIRNEDEFLVWQDVNDHEGFDVCADDHCQRYQGITRIISDNVQEAIHQTRGHFLVYDNDICDARYHKSCGGQTDIYSTAWEDRNYDYLNNISDDLRQHSAVRSEGDAERWLAGRPGAYCNTTDGELLKKILPAFDQETPDFYRWQVAYEREEIEEIIGKKSGIDFGELKDLVPLERGPSGRIFRLKIEGSKKTMIVGKELEIRRWLSPSHLLSSAFIVEKIKESDNTVKSFILKGGGWGHGVGLCQIGAAVMASKGFKAEEILAHYFTGAQIKKIY